MREKGNWETCWIRGVRWWRRDENKFGGGSRGYGTSKKRVLKEVGVEVEVRGSKSLKAVVNFEVARVDRRRGNERC